MFRKANIEISNICNAKCPWCTTGQKNRTNCSEKADYMSAKDFKKGIDYLLDSEIISTDSYIEPYNWGEPFLNPELNDICGILAERDLSYVLSTNASYFREISVENMRTLLTLRVSLSGFSAETYRHTHGLDFEKAIENILKFAEMLDRAKKRHCLEISFLTYKFNFYEIEKARQFFNSREIKMIPRLAYYNDFKQMNDFLKNDALPFELKELSDKHIFSDLLLKRKDEAFRKNASENFKCPQDDFLVFDTKWNIVPCCALTERENLGNLFECDCNIIRELKASVPECAECKKNCQHYIIHSPTDVYGRIDIDPLESELKYIATLYVDAGQGFSEEDTIRCEFSASLNNIKLKFKDFKKWEGQKIERVRFAPCSQGCVIVNLSADTDKSTVKICETNADKVIYKNNETAYLFDHCDPWFIYNLSDKENIEEIEFGFDLTILSEHTLKALI